MADVLSPRTRERIEAIAEDTTLSNVQKRDQIYTILVERAGLTGKAFFGHRKTRAETKQLSSFWKMAKRLVPEVSPLADDLDDGLTPAQVAEVEAIGMDADNGPICQVKGCFRPENDPMHEVPEGYYDQASPNYGADQPESPFHTFEAPK